MGVRNTVRKFLATKTRQIRVLNKTREKYLKNASERIEQNASKTIDFITYHENMLSEANSPNAPLGKDITRNMMPGKAKLAHVLLRTEIGGYVKSSVGIANPVRTYT